ncbi:Eukaryotic rRNA processing [Trema orientale]|uniref:Eukaryotic rRNA processing n=1 Tax=Trema orientale TaxID=63057 RepID=A0A2P5CFY6_TREOI|nr:Eukaryotic rRNA processing [Trema orientale]
MAIPNKGLSLLRQEKMEDDHDIGGFDGEVSDSETGSESELEEDGDGDVKLTEPSKNAIYNTDGLIDKLGDTSWPVNVGWIHKLSIDVDQEQQQVDVNDDLARELAFYNQALEGTRRAFEKLQSMGLPFLRPADYYAEMVKTDSHMEKVKGRLLVEKRRMEEADERKKAREAKKLAKEIQAQKTKERNKQKKEEIESVKKWRKQRQQSGFAKDDKDGEMDFSFEDGKAFERSNKRRPGVAPGDRSGGKTSRHGGTGKGMKNQKKREFRNSKFGFGGKKALRKLNTAETTNDMRSFNKVNISGNKKRKR